MLARFKNASIRVSTEQATKKLVIERFKELQGQENEVLIVQFESCEEVKTVLVKTITNDTITGLDENYNPVEHTIKRFKNLYSAIATTDIIACGEELFYLSRCYADSSGEIPEDILYALKLQGLTVEDTFSRKALRSIKDASILLLKMNISATEAKGFLSFQKVQTLKDCITLKRIGFHKCEISNKYIVRDEIVEFNNHIYSGSALREVGVAQTCSKCGKTYLARSSSELERNYCEECYREVPRCSICGETATDIVAGLALCRVHAQENTASGYHSNSSHGHPKLLGKVNPTFPLYLGVELEIDINERDPKNPRPGLAMAIAGRDLKEEKIEFTRDSSLTGYGFEMISQPKTIERWHEDREKYKHVFESLVECGMRGHDAARAGFHIHVSREAFGEKAPRVFTRLQVLLYRHFSKVLAISRRTKERMSSYAQFEGSLVNKSTFTQDDISFLRKFKSFSVAGHSMLAADGELPTFEFRVFRSTLNIETFMATLDFVYGLCKFANENDFDACNSVSWDDLRNFIASEDFNRYSDRIIKIAKDRVKGEASEIGDDDIKVEVVKEGAEMVPLTPQQFVDAVALAV